MRSRLVPPHAEPEDFSATRAEHADAISLSRHIDFFIAMIIQ